MTRYIFNTPVLTNYGTYRFEKIELAQAKELAKPAISVVGHEGAAGAISKLLGMNVKIRRVEVHMDVGDVALVFRIRPRLAEGTVLSTTETLQLPYEFGRLERIA